MLGHREPPEARALPSKTFQSIPNTVSGSSVRSPAQNCRTPPEWSPAPEVLHQVAFSRLAKIWKVRRQPDQLPTAGLIHFAATDAHWDIQENDVRRWCNCRASWRLKRSFQL